MDRYKRIQIISWVIVFVVLTGLVIWFITGRMFITNGMSYHIQDINGPYNEVARYNVEMDDINKVNINWVAGGVTVTPYEGTDIELIEYAQRSLDEDEYLVYTSSNHELSIKYSESKNRFLSTVPAKRLEIFLPVALADDLYDFTLSSVSGFVKVDHITADYFEVNTVSGKSELSNIKAKKIITGSTSGRIKLTDCESQQIKLNSVSGEVILMQVNADKITTDTTSGDMNFEDIVTKSLSFDTTSGDTVFEGSFQELIADSTSGDFKLTTKEAPESFRFDTVSGDVYLIMPLIDKFHLKFDTTSGDLDSEIPTISGGGSSNYRIETTSGDVTIKEYK